MHSVPIATSVIELIGLQSELMRVYSFRFEGFPNTAKPTSTAAPAIESSP